MIYSTHCYIVINSENVFDNMSKNLLKTWYNWTNLSGIVNIRLISDGCCDSVMPRAQWVPWCWHWHSRNDPGCARDHVWGLGNVTRLIREDTGVTWPPMMGGGHTWGYPVTQTKYKYINTKHYQITRRRILRLCSRNYLRMLMGLQMQIESFRTKRTNVMMSWLSEPKRW